MLLIASLSLCLAISSNWLGHLVSLFASGLSQFLRCSPSVCCMCLILDKLGPSLCSILAFKGRTRHSTLLALVAFWCIIYIVIIVFVYYITFFDNQLISRGVEKLPFLPLWLFASRELKLTESEAECCPRLPVVHIPDLGIVYRQSRHSTCSRTLSSYQDYPISFCHFNCSFRDIKTSRHRFFVIIKGLSNTIP